MSRPRPEHRPDGSIVWVHRFRLPPAWLTGKIGQRQVTCASEAECLRRERAILLAFAEEHGKPASRQTVGAYLRHYIEDVAVLRAHPAKQQGTRQTYMSWLRHIEPQLGDVLLARLDTRRCQQWIAALVRADAKPKSIALYAGLLRSALHHAQAAGVIDRDPMRAVSLPRIPTEDPPVWDHEEIRRFLALAERDLYHPVWRLALMTGMRQGELLALRWADIDLARGRITLTRAYTHANKREGPPKTPTSTRTVFLDRVTVAQLVAHWHWQQREIQGRPGTWPDNDLVCRSLRGTRLWASALRERLRILCANAAVPYLTFHGLRAVHSTRLLAAGHDIAVVARRLGHADTRTTRRHYYNIEEKAQARLAAGVPDALYGGDDDVPTSDVQEGS